MTKYFVYLMLSVLSFGLISCEDNEEDHIFDFELLYGITQCVCNQLGYVKALEHLYFKRDAIIEL